jgi:RecG-like helicase
MKKTSLLLALAVCALLTLPALAGKDVTITGEGTCAKCSLHQADKCQTVIQATENGKTVTYYVTQNKASKDFHDKVCEEPHKVTATGTVKEVNGKQELTVSKIELAR